MELLSDNKRIFDSKCFLKNYKKLKNDHLMFAIGWYILLRDF